MNNAIKILLANVFSSNAQDIPSPVEIITSPSTDGGKVITSPTTRQTLTSPTTGQALQRK